MANQWQDEYLSNYNSKRLKTDKEKDRLVRNATISVFILLGLLLLETIIAYTWIPPRGHYENSNASSYRNIDAITNLSIQADKRTP